MKMAMHSHPRVVGATLVPGNLKLPAGVNCICAQDKDGTKYFAINSTASSITFPAKNLTKRSSLFSKNVLPPFSISILR